MGLKNSKIIKTNDKCDLIINKDDKVYFPYDIKSNNGYSYVYFYFNKNIKDISHLQFTRIGNNLNIIKDINEIDLFLKKSNIIKIDKKLYREYQLFSNLSNTIRIRYGERNHILYIYRKL